ncbi:MAG: DUF2442 domain-containing protein [Bacillota bacterium]|nr:DUF2442 domain-containing protein [Bacillota bacterium]
MTEIKEVHPKADYKLEVELTNGSSVILNLQPKLNTIRFGILRDTEIFNRVETDGTVINWDKKVELSVSELFDLIKK